jgi:hypothetical protein
MSKLKIDLLAIDMKAGKPWAHRVAEENKRKRWDEIRRQRQRQYMLEKYGLAKPKTV